MDTEISVILPTFNEEKHIERCINSVLKQQLYAYELLVIDDGSTDQTLSLAMKLAASDKRVKVFHTTNQGVSHARNYGLSKVTGKYITFIDCDDYLCNKWLLRMSQLIQKEECDLACIGFASTREFEKKDTKKERVYSANEAIYSMLCEDTIHGYLWNKMFVYSIIKENNLFFDEELKVWEDIKFCFQYILRANKVLYDSNPYYYYSENPFGAISNFTIKKGLNIMDTWEYFMKNTSEIIDLHSIIEKKYADMSISLFSKMLYENDLDDIYFDEMCSRIEILVPIMSLKKRVKFLILKNFPGYYRKFRKLKRR